MARSSTPLFTLTDPPRGELPGESWRECCEQERAYTLGWREEGAPWSAGRCPPFKDARAEHWLMGYDDARRNRVRASLDRRFILALGPSRWAAYDGRTRAEFASRDEAMAHMSGGGK